MVNVRSALEKLYTGTCTISNAVATEDPATGKTSMTFVVVTAAQPCRLSFASLPTADVTDNVAQVAQTTKLFLSPDVEVLPGSVIEVTQNGATTTYKASSAPVKHSNHQEITLAIKERYA